jgi:ATP-dependent exoDNAse (exonuclease V) beta subunit
LAEAFREFNLPYILHSGNGFFETQEISDIISILNFLHNPYDDISLTGALKSPFFSLSDTMLLKININHSEDWKYSPDPLWDKLQGFCSADNSEAKEFDDSAAAKRAVRILSDLLSRAASMTIASLIGEILNRTTWRATVKNMRGKEQAEANIEKLISYARDFENRGFRNMFDFTEELKLIIDSNVNEGEAVFSASTDAINVMTIHASKGLEFPVVALYNSNARSGKPESFFVNEKFGISFPTLVADQQSGVRKTSSTLLQELNRDMKKVSESAEEKRILYVALTRAESHIIVSGSTKPSKSGALSAPLGFMKMIVAGLGTDLIEMTANDTFMQSDNLFILKDDELFEHKLTFPIKITTNVSSEATETADKIKNRDIPERLILINDLASEISKEIYSATKLSTFEKDPVSYIDRYILGLPQEYESEGAKPKAGSDNDSVQGSMAGTLIHEVLENIKYWFDESGNVDEEKLKEYADHAVNESERYITPKLKKRILIECRAVASTDLLKSVAKNISESSSESTSLIPIGQDYITAATDLIVETDSGKEIWDWKTNYIDSSEKMDKLAKAYELQMKIYVYFYFLNSPDQADYTARLLFTAEAAAKIKTENWTRMFTWSNAEVESFGNLIAGKIEELRTGTFTV